MPGLHALLARQNATLQDRWHARLYLMFPLVIACLSIFWLASGIIGLISDDEARAVLADVGTSQSVAWLAVAGGSIADIALGLAVLFRPWARLACMGMIALSAAYLLMGSLLTPALWLAPLGPFVKVVPGMVLAAMACILLERR